jgi:medium-chain acyl-[acyl-carrier-protein] hydrolase
VPNFPNLGFNSWVRPLKLNPNPQLRLFCFPHAGGGASLFRLWHKSLPAAIEVCPIQLPGRESRVRERPYTDLIEMVEDLYRVLLPALDFPFVFFGHSLGALVAFELSRLIRKRDGILPAHLIVAACPAPHSPDQHPPVHHLPRREFIDSLKQMEGTPEEVFKDPGLIDFFLPLLRADFTVYETYLYYRDTPLDCPISAYGGLGDDGVTEESLRQWGDQTNSTFIKRMFPGNHYFLRDNPRELFQAVLKDVSKLLI